MFGFFVCVLSTVVVVYFTRTCLLIVFTSSIFLVPPAVCDAVPVQPTPNRAQDVHAQAASQPDLRVSVQGGSDGGEEGLQRPQAPRAADHPQSARHQDDAVAAVQGPGHRAVCLASLLLVSATMPQSQLTFS